jgi:thiosulfate dehydrogenase [quinone] large subunit
MVPGRSIALSRLVEDVPEIAEGEAAYRWLAQDQGFDRRPPGGAGATMEPSKRRRRSMASTVKSLFGGGYHVEDPPIARALFASTGAAWFWLIVRLYVGYQWLEAGLHKVAEPGWALGNGAAILGFWQRAVAVPAPPARAPITYEWYRGLIQSLIDAQAHTWFAPLIAWGEVLVGVGLIVGGLVGVAAFFGALMNMSFLLAGTTSSNPVLFVLAIGLMLAWKVAGYYGADRVLLPLLGTPWHGVVRDEPVAGARTVAKAT